MYIVALGDMDIAEFDTLASAIAIANTYKNASVYGNRKLYDSDNTVINNYLVDMVVNLVGVPTFISVKFNTIDELAKFEANNNVLQFCDIIVNI